MENIKKLILKNNLIKQGETIGVAVSGGKDSMALLCKLNELSKELDFEIVAITVDHSLRENGKTDAKFVVDFCNSNNIRVYKFKVDSMFIAKQKTLSIESAAREARYGVFETMVKKGVCDKIAIAHHKSDQAETILMHLFRGSSITGLKGMSLIRDGVFIRPMLNTDKSSIEDYILQNDIPTVEDETNQDDEYNRNYIRNDILPLILKRWPNAISSIVNFSNLATLDDEYINSQAPTDGFLISDKEVKIPLTYFLYQKPVISRIVYKALHIIGVKKDIESKHIDMILNFASQSQNGKKLNLPLKVLVHKEYDYLTLENKQKEEISLYEKYKIGTIDVGGQFKIINKKVKNLDNKNGLCFDGDKIPKDAVWRFRKNGDVFSKYGGGTKKLKEYLIDIKYPQRLRNTLPVLAVENEVLIIGGIEISDKIKVTDKTQKIYKITIE